jgi:hypothetical protein
LGTLHFPDSDIQLHTTQKIKLFYLAGPLVTLANFLLPTILIHLISQQNFGKKYKVIFKLIQQLGRHHLLEPRMLQFLYNKIKLLFMEVQQDQGDWHQTSSIYWILKII